MSRINLSGTWNLKSTDEKIKTTIELPGDIFSALISSGIISHPYEGRNELDVQGLHQLDWILEREFEYMGSDDSLKYFHAEVVDTASRIELNGQEIGRSDSMFIPLFLPIGEFLVKGRNQIRIYIDSAEKTAVQRARNYAYPVPTNTAPVSSPNRNFLRKVQCHAGWDWGPCLMTGGVYNKVELILADVRLDGIHYDLLKKGENWEIRVQGEVHSGLNQEAELFISAAGASLHDKIFLPRGKSVLDRTMTVESPVLWWPNGEGIQKLYPLEISVGGSTTVLNIGFRTIEVINNEDDNGLSMFFRVNGRDIFAKGANWIPADALPSGQTESKIRHLLESSAKVHMNMIRVWGGGQYESDFFYNLCDELGLLVWQDFMFSCSLYPTSREFLFSVDREVRSQIPRLKNHPSLALFCGNNENVGALTWYEESRKNRDLYIVDYDRLNEGVIGRAVKELAPGHTWWPSSPSAGEGDYSDCWHDDSRGDMHYWSVWHEGKPFESYYDILPRFCSEFGFQSFPSFNQVKEYADEEEWNVTSPVMMHHQKNNRGNEIIISTLSRYFRFPSSFKDFLYLSQVQQSWAIQTAVEYWRSNRPTCMGALYWQLNDNWPVASWASIEYSGGWKLLHYNAERFFNPLHIAGWIKGGVLTAAVINDGQETRGKAILNFRNFKGTIIRTIEKELTISGASSLQFYNEPVLGEKEGQDQFLELIFRTGEVERRNVLFLQVPRMCSLEHADVVMKIDKTSEGNTLVLTTDKPAFFVYLSSKEKGEFSDNGFHLLPGEEKKVKFVPATTGGEHFEMTHLKQTY